MAIFTIKVPRLFATKVGTANSATVQDIPAPAAGKCNYIFGIACGYDTTAGVGVLNIEVGPSFTQLTNKFSFPIHGNDKLIFDTPIPIGQDNVCRVTLTPGGTGRIGRLNVWGDESIPPPPLG